MAGEKRYPDLRYSFIRGLIQHERWQRTRLFLKSAAECTSRAIVSLELADRPVKTVKQAEKLEGIGGETVKRLRQIHGSKRFSKGAPSGGIYCSSAGALLAALLAATEDAICDGHSQDRSVLVPEAELKSRAEALSEEIFLSDGKKGLCQAWWRIEVLIKRDLVKRRSLNKSPVYHLLPMGREVAVRLKGINDREQIRRPPFANAVPSLISWRVESEVRNVGDALYTNDSGNDGVIMLVDTREWGGDQLGLGQLCEMLERCGMTYKTQHLSSGDYTWIWRCNQKERLLPHLVERKRADDIANSLNDGRFWKQITKMTEWKSKFEKDGISGQLHYFLEGEPEQYVVRCADGCQGVGKCGNPTLAQVKNAIHDLESHIELDVQKTDGIEATVLLLASITTELQQRTRKGDFDKMVAIEASVSCQHDVTASDCENGNLNSCSVDKVSLKDCGMMGKTKTTTCVRNRSNSKQDIESLPCSSKFSTDELDSNSNIKTMGKQKNKTKCDEKNFEVICDLLKSEHLKRNIESGHESGSVRTSCLVYEKMNIHKDSGCETINKTDLDPVEKDAIFLDNANLKGNQNISENRITSYLAGVSQAHLSSSRLTACQNTEHMPTLACVRNRLSSNKEHTQCIASSDIKSVFDDNQNLRMSQGHKDQIHCSETSDKRSLDNAHAFSELMSFEDNSCSRSSSPEEQTRCSSNSNNKSLLDNNDSELPQVKNPVSCLSLKSSNEEQTQCCVNFDKECLLEDNVFHHPHGSSSQCSPEEKNWCSVKSNKKRSLGDNATEFLEMKSFNPSSSSKSSSLEAKTRCLGNVFKKGLLDENATDLPRLKRPRLSPGSRMGKGKVYLMKLSRQNSCNRSEVMQVCSKADSCYMNKNEENLNGREKDNDSFCRTPDSFINMNVCKHPLQHMSDDEESLPDLDEEIIGQEKNSKTLLMTSTIERYRQFSESPKLNPVMTKDITSTSQTNEVVSLEIPVVLSENITPGSTSQMTDTSRDTPPVMCSTSVPETRQERLLKEKIALVKSVLPQVSPTKVLTVLKVHSGNIDDCICALVENGLEPENKEEVVDLT